MMLPVVRWQPLPPPTGSLHIHECMPRRSAAPPTARTARRNAALYPNLGRLVNIIFDQPRQPLTCGAGVYGTATVTSRRVGMVGLSGRLDSVLVTRLCRTTHGDVDAISCALFVVVVVVVANCRSDFISTSTSSSNRNFLASINVPHSLHRHVVTY